MSIAILRRRLQDRARVRRRATRSWLLRRDFDGNQPIRILFWNDEMFTKQKHMIIKRRERENQQDE
jgi:hypothetical protein